MYVYRVFIQLAELLNLITNPNITNIIPKKIKIKLPTENGMAFIII